MIKLKSVTLAAALIAGTTSLAMAQNAPDSDNGMPPQSYKGPGNMQDYKTEDFKAPSNASTNMPPQGYNGPGAMQSYKSSEYGGTETNARASGGSGAHQTAQRTGSGETNQKILGNQNGYRLYSYDYRAAGPAGSSVAYCESRFRSYDPATGMYRGFDGVMRPCP